MRPLTLLAAFLLVFSISCRSARAANFPSPVVPQGFGVNIHFTGAPAKDIDGLAKLGVNWVRMDFFWAGIEKTRGVYDFSDYDTLVDALASHNIHPLFILDYENPLYEAGSPSTSEARAAFARFAAAGARHFAGKGVLWEIWNEPNISFWKPAPNVQDYAALALATAQVIKAADPKATVIAPGMSAMDFAFAESCFQAGLLKYIDAVSFHPYRPTNPETAAADYTTLRGLIARYAPAGKDIALVSSEWGYSTAGVSEEQQAQYLTREWLSNLEQEIKVSIWYDWHDDGVDPKNGEHNFGAVNWDYSPKPAFTAAQTLIHSLSGYRYIKRVATASDSDYLLIFAKGKSYKLAAWTTGNDHTIPIPFVGTATLTHMFGETESLASHAATLKLPISQSPVYVAVPPGNTAIALAASWTVSPAHGLFRQKGAQVSIQFTNPTANPLTVQFGSATAGRSLSFTVMVSNPKRVSSGQTVTITMPAMSTSVEYQLALGTKKLTFEPLEEEADFAPVDPLYLSIAPAPDGRYFAMIENPSKFSFTGTLDQLSYGLSKTKPAIVKTKVVIPNGQNEADFWLNPAKTNDSVLTLALDDAEGIGVVSSPAQRFTPYAVPPSNWKAALDGDPKVVSKIDLAPAPAGAPLNAPAAKLDYEFGTGWSFVRIFDPNAKPLPGKPIGETIWVKGDGSGNALRMRFSDSTGQTFQEDFGKCDWTDWRPISCSFTGANHWGGANDGVIHYPIKVDTIFLLDSTALGHKTGSLLICDPEIIYGG